MLIKTRNSRFIREREFHRDYTYLAPDGAEYLVSLGVRLVGVDYLSIEQFHSGHHRTHRTLLERGIVIVEGLDLSEPPPGPYELYVSCRFGSRDSTARRRARCSSDERHQSSSSLRHRRRARIATAGIASSARAAVERFGLDAEDFQYRHEETVGAFESGQISLDEYLDVTVFCATARLLARRVQDVHVRAERTVAGQSSTSCAAASEHPRPPDARASGDAQQRERGAERVSDSPLRAAAIFSTCSSARAGSAFASRRGRSTSACSA